VSSDSDSEKFLDAAKGLTPLLFESAEEADRSGHLSEVVVEALRAAGLLTLQVPRFLGGADVDIRTAFNVYRELGHGCGSSAWVAMILSGGSLITSLFPLQAREEIWSTDSRAAVCSQLPSTGTAHQVRGGMVVSGRWPTVSGVHQSQWAIVRVSTAEGHEEDADSRLALLPLSEASIEDTWHVTGLRATGSDTVVFEDQFVPDHRLSPLLTTASTGDGVDRPRESLHKSVIFTAINLTVVAPLLGMAEEALALVLKELGPAASGEARKKPSRGSLASVQFAVADAASLIDTARLHIDRALDDVEHHVDTQAVLDPTRRARVRMDAGTAAKSLREAVRLLLATAGSGGFLLANPVQRMWRDLEIGSTHVVIAPDPARTNYGQALLGLSQ
jgi:3-hydroxy-9,10-secoandrosta-1,3,5(10)-triene-9,17-dione monooxygenase